MSLKDTRKKGITTLISIAVIAIAVYIGFEPLIANVPDGVAKSVISSSFGAIFVIILTMYLLNKQTEIEQESKKSERVFDEKVKLYQTILDLTKEMMMDGKITKEEMNRLPFPLIRLSMLGRNETISAFKDVNNMLTTIYQKSDEDEVNIDDSDKKEVYKLLATFAAKCRDDLEIGNEEINNELINDTVETIESTVKAKTKDYSKISFNGKEHPKNRYIWEVLNNFVNENPDIKSADFEKTFPRDGGKEFRNAGIKKSGTYETWKLYDEAQELFDRTGHKRFFVCDKGKDYKKDKDMVLCLKDVEICISSQWASDQMKPFVQRMKSKGIKTE